MLRRQMDDFSQQAYRNWFVAGLSDEFKRDPRRIMALGWPVAIARLKSGQAAALEDRCPHRGVPLSDGVVTDRGLSCRFHGWTFDGGGRCVGMPGGSAGGLLGDIRVPAYRVIERDGLVWICKGQEGALPARIANLDAGARRGLWQAKWRVPVIDAQHYALGALHAHAQAGRVRAAPAAHAASLEVSRDGFLLDYVGQSARPGLFGALFAARRPGVRCYFCALSVAQLEYRYAGGGCARITLCFSPETLLSTRIYILLHVQGRWPPAWFVRASLRPLLRHLAEMELTGIESRGRPAAEFSPRWELPQEVRPYLEEVWRGS